VVEVSASQAVCSGTTALRCDFETLAPGSTASVGLTVRASASGSFIGQVRLSAANDINPANDSVDVAVEISVSSAAVTDNSATRAKSGGGGRFEWLMLVFLALIAMRTKLVRVPRAPR
jgi:hypothetical protein